MLRDIQSLLGRFSFEPPEGARKKAVIEAVSNVVGVTLLPKQIRIAENCAYIEVPSVLRSELMLQKSNILQYLRTYFGEKARNPVTDIR